jgi:uncharacterized protein
MNWKGVREFAIEKLQKELPEILYYHSLEHVMDVYRVSIEIAQEEGVDGEDLELLKTAVLFHDIGYTVQAPDHEKIGCEIAREVLIRYDYSGTQIDRVCSMIMSTRIPHSPSNLLEQIICDADLDYLGRDDYWRIGKNLYREMLAMGTITNEEEWNNLQISYRTSVFYCHFEIEKR